VFCQIEKFPAGKVVIIWVISFDKSIGLLSRPTYRWYQLPERSHHTPMISSVVYIRPLSAGPWPSSRTPNARPGLGPRPHRDMRPLFTA